MRVSCKLFKGDYIGSSFGPKESAGLEALAGKLAGVEALAGEDWHATSG